MIEVRRAGELHGHDLRLEPEGSEEGSEEEHVVIAVPRRPPPLHDIGQHQVRGLYQLEPIRVRHIDYIVLNKLSQPVNHPLLIIIPTRPTIFHRRPPNEGEIRVIIPNSRQLLQRLRQVVPQWD